MQMSACFGVCRGRDPENDRGEPQQEAARLSYLALAVRRCDPVFRPRWCCNGGQEEQKRAGSSCQGLCFCGWLSLWGGEGSEEEGRDLTGRHSGGLQRPSVVSLVSEPVDEQEVIFISEHTRPKAPNLEIHIANHTGGVFRLMHAHSHTVRHPTLWNMSVCFSRIYTEQHFLTFNSLLYENGPSEF